VTDATPIWKAQRLLNQVSQIRPLHERAHYAMKHEKQLTEALTDLLAYIEGLRTGSAAELRRVDSLAFELLSAIAPLFEKEAGMFALGQPSAHQQWLTDKAPLLREAFERACEFLKVEFVEGK
jgi:hypothetical protein